MRHEILTRVKDVEAWINLGLRGDEYIEIDELEPLKQRIADFLLKKNPLKIDGKFLKPILDRTSYVKVAPTGIQLLERPERLEISTALIGVIFAYITQGIPNEVAVEWELFTDRIRMVPTTSIDPAGPFLNYVTPEDNIHTWTNHLKAYRPPTVEQVAVSEDLTGTSIPIVSMVGLAFLIPLYLMIKGRRKKARPMGLMLGILGLVLVGSVLAYPYLRVTVTLPGVASVPQLPDKDAQLILGDLLKNVYRSFEFRNETDVYDKLAVSVSGDLLTDIYLESRRSLAVQQAGGAQAKVKKVEVIELSEPRRLDYSDGFSVDATWTV